MVVDFAAVETGCMLAKYIKVATKYVHLYFLVELLLLLPLRAAAAAHNISTEAERGSVYCGLLIRLRYSCCGFVCVYFIAVAAVEKGYMPEKTKNITFCFLGCAAAAFHYFNNREGCA